ncbi:PLP-dependent aminotransferase family protein [soil metagenome]
MKRYEDLAADMEASIRTGLLRPGERLPSVRQASASRGISASTIFQAYYLLEARGLVRARERSGYYVLEGVRRVPATPDKTSQPQQESVAIDSSERVFEIVESTMSSALVPFGSAFPSPALFPLERLGQAMASSIQSVDTWGSVDDIQMGNSGLRRLIAQRYMAEGVNVSADDIVMTNGALQALNLCLSAVTRPGDSVIVSCPTFYSALQSIERLSLKAVEVPTHPCEGIDLAALEQAIHRHKPKACWLMTTFDNPLGCSMTDAKKQALVELLARHDIPLIEDDVYAELYFGPKRPRPAKAYDTRGLVLHCSSFSKCLAPGYRLGWAVPGRYVRDVARRRFTTTLGMPVPPQVAVASYLERGGYDRHLRKLRRTLAGQLQVFSQAVCQYFPADTRATLPEGGYFFWVELPAGADALKIHAKALAHGISVAPGPIFSARQDFSNCLRLNFGHAWDHRAEQAMATLGRLVLPGGH